MVMNEHTRPQILLTNDDGIQSPGLWAAAEALSKLGFVTVAAPREQSSGSGRSLPVTSDGKITATILQVGEQKWTTYAIGGTPAQAVLHAIMEIMPEPPDLVVSGINYGENIGHSITISGTIGAAMEGAAFGIPSIAVSQQLHDEDYLGYSRTVDFSSAAHFTQLFAEIMMKHKMPEDVDILKIDVPNDATPNTGWHITRLAHHRYYAPQVVRTGTWEEPGGYIGGTMGVAKDEVEPGTDAYMLAFNRCVAVTPLSLDMTARINLENFEKLLREQMK
jgi:5'-nucleotidase